MAIQLFLEHDDFKKARRALIASAVATIFFTTLSMKSDEIILFDLRLEIDQTKLVIFSIAALLYFSYIFSIRAYEFSRVMSIANPELQVNEISRTLDSEIRRVIVEQTLQSMDRAEMRQTIGRSGPKNTFDLADNTADLANEVRKKVAFLGDEPPQEHEFEEVDRIVDLIEEAISTIKGSLIAQLRRSRITVLMAEIAPPGFAVFVAGLFALHYFSPGIYSKVQIIF